GEIEAAIRVANDVVRPREAPALISVGESFDLPVRPHTAQESAVAFAQNEAPLKIEGCAVTTLGVAPDHLGPLARCHAKQFVLPDVDEVPVVIGVPNRALSEDEAGGEALGLGGFQDLRQIVGMHRSCSLGCGRLKLAWRPPGS